MVRTFFLYGWMVLSLCQALWAEELTEAGNMALPDSTLIFSPPQPVLSAHDKQALRMSVTAANAPRFPVQDADRTLHRYGSGRPTLICSPLKLCLVELQEGERVVKNGIHLGDKVRWKVTPTVGAGKKTFLVIKPTGSGLETNLVIITDRHSYDVRLVSQPGARLSRLAWSYPDETEQAWQDYYTNQDAGKKDTAERSEQTTATNNRVATPQKQNITTHPPNLLSQLDFNYHISGCKACHWRPVRVYNNGIQTVIELPDLRGKEAPALLVLGQDEERMVNYRILGHRYIVDQVFDQAALLLGVGERQQRVVIQRTMTPAPANSGSSPSPVRPRATAPAKRIQYFVQLLSAIDEHSAKSHQAALRGMGYRVELQPMYGQSQPVLRIGPWRNRAGADAALRQLRSQYQQATLWEESS